MGTTLFVGRLSDPEMVGQALDFVEAAHFEEVKGAKEVNAKKAGEIVIPWFAVEEDQGALVIDTLNEASQVLFLNHAAELEGLTEETAINQSRWQHLPYWQQSVWIPFNGRPHKPRVTNVRGWPIFVGTVPGLLNDLKEMAALSKLQLGSKPENFDFMIANPSQFQAESKELSADDTIRWIWFAYYFGAKTSLERSVTCSQAG
jgi:hypothetical protein